MSQENYIQVPQKWTLIEDLIPEFDNTATYIVYHRGESTIMCLEGDSTPANNAKAGTPFYKDQRAIYEKGTQNQYIKALGNNSYINITKVA